MLSHCPKSLQKLILTEQYERDGWMANFEMRREEINLNMNQIKSRQTKPDLTTTRNAFHSIERKKQQTSFINNFYIYKQTPANVQAYPLKYDEVHDDNADNQSDAIHSFSSGR